MSKANVAPVTVNPVQMHQKWLPTQLVIRGYNILNMLPAFHRLKKMILYYELWSYFVYIYNKISKRQVDEELMLGSAMHARLEQLQREVMVVQEQQSKLATQRSEIAMEKELLARAIQDAEAQKKRYAGSKLQLQRENQKIDELKQQASYLFASWFVCNHSDFSISWRTCSQIGKKKKSAGHPLKQVNELN